MDILTDGVDDGASDDSAVGSEGMQVLHVLALGNSEANSNRHLRQEQASGLSQTHNPQSVVAFLGHYFLTQRGKVRHAIQ